MFDVGFSEICMVGLVALLVIGPEKLPQVARFAGFWIGKARRMANSVQQEFKENLYAEEVRQLMQQQSEMMENLELESKGMQDLLAGDVQQLQTGLIKTLTDLDQDKQNSQVNAVADLPAQPTAPSPQIIPPPPPLKRSKSKQKHRHGKK